MDGSDVCVSERVPNKPLSKRRATKNATLPLTALYLVLRSRMMPVYDKERHIDYHGLRNQPSSHSYRPFRGDR
jgi:hypothetical protein